MVVYYVDPANGDDSNSGESETDAFKTLFPVTKEGDVDLSPGDEVLVKDNAVMSYNGTLDFEGTKGEENNLINIQGFNQSRPVMDFNKSQGTGIDMPGCQYVRIADFEIKNVGDNAIRCNGWSGNDAESCVFENLEIHDYGYDNDWAGNGISFYANSYNHTIRNCKAYNGHTENHSDGYYVGGPMDNMSGGHTYVDCEAWNNADDGFDLYRADPNRPVLIKGCIAHHNGTDGSGVTGDGNGFKMAGGWNTGGHEVQLSVSYANTARGFDANGGSFEITFKNCTSFNNGTHGFQFTGATEEDHLAYNCLSWNNKKSEVANVWNVIEGSNSWDLKIGDPLFVSTVEGEKGFLELSSNSPAIDAGEDVGLPFNGDAPDLGAKEFGGGDDSGTPDDGSGDGSTDDGSTDDGTTDETTYDVVLAGTMTAVPSS